MCSREGRARTTATDPGVGGLNRTRLATFQALGKSRPLAQKKRRARSQPRGPCYSHGQCVCLRDRLHTGQCTVKYPVNSGDLRINVGGIAMRAN